MIGFLALFIVAGKAPAAPATDAYDADAAALRAVGGYEMLLPVRKCIRDMAIEQRARTSEIGNNAAAAAFLHKEFGACGYRAAAARLLARLRQADRSASDRTIRRRAELELQAVRVEAEMWAEHAVRLPLPPPPTLKVPCTTPDCPVPTGKH
jgi:hypothetical protein